METSTFTTRYNELHTFQESMDMLNKKLPTDLQLHVLEKYMWKWAQEETPLLDPRDWLTSYVTYNYWFPDYAKWKCEEGIININVKVLARCKSKRHLIMFTQILDKVGLLSEININFTDLQMQDIFHAKRFIQKYYKKDDPKTLAKVNFIYE